MKYLRFIAIVVLTCGFISCAATENKPDNRQSVRRKPGPNLDRSYIWGSRPPGNDDAPHVRD
jgi:hypothetical protein